ncbi:MAG: hypothetical protein JNK22_03105 [Rhodocyclaceae bacterium]|nr:hypothetical protein [Rhodocyclaceae bacterium]
MMDKGAKHAIGERLQAALGRAAALRVAAREDTARRQAWFDFRAWQSERLARTHADLLASPRHGPAAAFFLADLYGPKELSKRDAEIARIVPIMVRMLPPAALETLADAVEMDALSEDLDAAMVAALDGRVAGLDDAAYGRAWRAVGRRGDRERQIELTRGLGEALDRLTRQPLIRTALRVMRGPAHLAGFGELQDFLERGFDAFRHMRGAEEFLERILGREREFMEAMFAGRPFPAAPS